MKILVCLSNCAFLINTVFMHVMQLLSDYSCFVCLEKTDMLYGDVKKKVLSLVLVLIFNDNYSFNLNLKFN